MSLCLNIIATTVFMHRYFSKTLTQLCLKFFEGLTQWALVPIWTTIRKTILHKHENVTNILKIKRNVFEVINPMRLCAPWSKSLYLSIYNRPPCPPSIIIIGWWIYNTGADKRGSLDSVPKITFGTVFYPPI